MFRVCTEVDSQTKNTRTTLDRENSPENGHLGTGVKGGSHTDQRRDVRMMP
jgi:hypothetical protein